MVNTESLLAIWARAFRFRQTPLLFILSFSACNPIRGLPEASFDLAPDSRLPRWFLLPTGYRRDDVTVTITYYVPWASIDDAVTELADQRRGQTLVRSTGQRCWHPQIDRITRNEHGGFDRGSRPRYTIIRVADVMEVFDHPEGDSKLRITDDPVIVQEANESLQRGECRKE